MSVESYKLREAAVINFVYRLSQAVRRLKDGRQVSDQEITKLLAQADEMGVAIQELRSAYPELPGIFERMYLRLQILLGERAQTASAGQLRVAARP